MATGNAIQSTSGGITAETWINSLGLEFATLPHPFLCPSGITFGAQVLSCYLTYATRAATLDHLGCWIGVAGATPGAGINGLAIYSSDSATLATLQAQTGDMTAVFTTVGYGEGVLTAPYAVKANTNYWLAALHNLTSVPTWPGQTAATTLPDINGQRIRGFKAAQASFPATFNPQVDLSQFSTVPFLTTRT